METVKTILHTKGAEIWSVGPETLLVEALKLMAQRNIGALAVVKDGRLVGLLSERDYARKVSLALKTTASTFVADIMSTEIISVGTRQTARECLSLMVDHHIRHLPVVEDDRLLGMVSINDVARAIIAEQQVLIDELEYGYREAELEPPEVVRSS